MSDGDRDLPAATPGSRRPDDDGSSDRLTRKQRPSPGAAPWERSRAFNSTPNPPASGQDPDPGGGSHTDGVSVADLIAKVRGGGSAPRISRRPGRGTRTACRRRLRIDTATAQLPRIRDSDVPDLAAAARRRKAEALLLGKPDGATALRPDDVAKRRSKPKGKPRRPVVVAGRVAIALVSLVALVATGGAWQWSASKNNIA